MSGQDDVFRRLQARALARFGGISRALDMTKLPAAPMIHGLTVSQYRAITVRATPPAAPQGKGHDDE